jgi:large subunit ribosomal protein L47
MQKVSSLSATKSNLTRGLSDFFESGSVWIWNKSDLKTGRPWSSALLRNKSFEDLHVLWWQCLKEMNKLTSQREEANRFDVMYPHSDRIHSVKLTMAHIKQVLGERRLAYLKANEIYQRLCAKKDQATENKTEDEINLHLLKTIPTPTLGLVQGAVLLGMKPYKLGIAPYKNRHDKKLKRRLNAEYYPF